MTGRDHTEDAYYRKLYMSRDGEVIKDSAECNNPNAGEYFKLGALSRVLMACMEEIADLRYRIEKLERPNDYRIRALKEK